MTTTRSGGAPLRRELVVQKLLLLGIEAWRLWRHKGKSLDDDDDDDDDDDISSTSLLSYLTLTR